MEKTGSSHNPTDWVFYSTLIPIQVYSNYKYVYQYPKLNGGIYISSAKVRESPVFSQQNRASEIMSRISSRVSLESCNYLEPVFPPPPQKKKI
jgi:hypothetical protein